MPSAKATVLAPALETKNGFELLSAEQFSALGIPWQEFLTKSIEAASRHLATLTPEWKKNARGQVEYAILKSDRHLTASTILCPEFRLRFKELLGPDLVVLVPDRFTVFVFPRRTGDFQKLGPAVAAIFEESIYPASSEAFELNENGMKAIGSLLISDEDAAASE
ncbi:MAG: hypothetical protein KA004_16600 [Verrucomicrobiales bacterium]|nr:hypothetical protein [Verrucomicrobiales bacterium]